MTETTIDLSETIYRWIAGGSIVVALLSLMATVIALFMSARAIRDAQRENRLTKEAERAMFDDNRAFELLMMASGNGMALQPNKNGVGFRTDFTLQQIGAAMLVDYPRAINGLIAIRNAHREFIDSGRVTDTELLEVINAIIEGSIAGIKRRKLREDK